MPASPLTAWESFYVIVGSSAAALTGLMFVVIALIADLEVKGSSRTIAAFGTPTIVHFCAALLVSAILSSPWPSLHGPAIALGVCGLCGVGYVCLVVARARGQSEYKPVFEDWLWHTAFPFTAYAAIVTSAFDLFTHTVPALFVIGGATLSLVFIGIHNAWDTVTYLAIGQKEQSGDSTR